MRRALAMVVAFALTLCSGVATAGTPTDDENDYEGRVGGDEETYFGFDLSANGKRVNGITAFLRYECEGGESGSLLVTTEGGLQVKDGEFSGKTTGESKLDVTYRTAGELKGGGRAEGTIEAKGVLAGTVMCKAKNDGAWKAKKGRDIDSPLFARTR